MTATVHVMVAVLRDAAGRVLIAQRPEGKSQAGRWEFPGGKLEPNEVAEAGLRRELLEELGIVAGPMRRLIEIHHAYPDVTVRLDVREIAHFGGSPFGCEGQALKWVAPEQLRAEDILEADRPIIQALRLPDFCLITPDPGRTSQHLFFARLDASLARGISLVQLRAPSLPREEFIALAREVLPVCRQRNARLLLNAPADTLNEVDADGIHLNGKALFATRARPVPPGKWLSAACHSPADMRKAHAVDVDFVLISPVAATATHPHQSTLGWYGFTALVRDAAMPAYALGGMERDDLYKVREAGGRGVAAIRGLWESAVADG